MKTRTFRILADDGDLAVEISVIVAPRKGFPLEENELDVFEKKCARQIATFLTELPYSDFGMENTRIELTISNEKVSG